MHAPVFSSVSMTFKITLIIRSLGASAFASIRSTQLYFCHNNCGKGNGSEKLLHSSSVQMRLPLSRKRQKKPCLSLLQRRMCHSMHQIFTLVNSPDNSFYFSQQSHHFSYIRTPVFSISKSILEPFST